MPNARYRGGRFDEIGDFSAALGCGAMSADGMAVLPLEIVETEHWIDVLVPRAIENSAPTALQALSH